VVLIENTQRQFNSDGAMVIVRGEGGSSRTGRALSRRRKEEKGKKARRQEGQRRKGGIALICDLAHGTGYW
jgi:hypothetical protein